jgi:hypothetical protein
MLKGRVGRDSIVAVSDSTPSATSSRPLAARPAIKWPSMRSWVTNAAIWRRCTGNESAASDCKKSWERYESGCSQKSKSMRTSRVLFHSEWLE